MLTKDEAFQLYNKFLVINWEDKDDYMKKCIELFTEPLDQKIESLTDFNKNISISRLETRIEENEKDILIVRNLLQELGKRVIDNFSWIERLRTKVQRAEELLCKLEKGK